MTHGTAAVILSIASAKMRSNISTRMKFCLSSRPLLHGDSALANMKSMLMTSHILRTLSLANFPPIQVRQYTLVDRIPLSTFGIFFGWLYPVSLMI